MFVKPISKAPFGVRIISPEQQRKSIAAYEKLLIIFKQFVYPIAKRKVKILLSTGPQRVGDFEVNMQYVLSETVRNWIQTLQIVAIERNKNIPPFINLSELKNNMFPSMKLYTKIMGEEFYFSHTAINTEDFYSILKAVQQSLPLGQIVPEAAIEVLKLEGIRIIQ